MVADRHRHFQSIPNNFRHGEHHVINWRQIWSTEYASFTLYIFYMHKFSPGKRRGQYTIHNCIWLFVTRCSEGTERVDSCTEHSIALQYCDIDACSSVCVHEQQDEKYQYTQNSTKYVGVNTISAALLTRHSLIQSCIAIKRLVTRNVYSAQRTNHKAALSIPTPTPHTHTHTVEAARSTLRSAQQYNNIRQRQSHSFWFQ